MLPIFENAKIGEVMQRGDTGPGEDGSVLSVTLELDEQPCIGLNRGPLSPFTPAMAIFSRCKSQAEVGYYRERPRDAGAPGQSGWLSGKFGVSRQIVPTALGDPPRDANVAKAGAVTRAMLRITRLDVGLLTDAYGQAN